MSNIDALSPASPKLLISACLLGNPVRYDGQSKSIHHDGLAQLQVEGRLVAFCPEMAGGLPVPRARAEIVGGDGAAVIAGGASVQTQAGSDVSKHFIAGAEAALALCQQQRISIAVLTEASPSCGSDHIYDGRFTRQLIPASGVTTALLRQHGITVFSQHQLEQALELLLTDTTR